MNPMEMAEKLMSGELVVVVAQKPEAQKMKLSPDEQALADSLVAIATKYGKFNEDETGIWAGYEAAKDNVVAHIGVKCSNCALYQGNGVCKIIDKTVEDGGKCRFAVIPDGVVNGVWTPDSKKEGPRKKKSVKFKALGASIGGSTASADDMIDRDGDGMIFDGTPDEQPVKRKPKGDYQPMDNSFLERRRRQHVRQQLRRQGITPTRNDESNIYEDAEGNLQIHDGRTDEEIVAREDARATFNVDEDRKKFVRNQLRKRGITPTASMADRSDEERQARREARAEYDRRMRAGAPQGPASDEQDPGMGPQEFPPGYVPGRPADRYPEPPRKLPPGYVPGKPADRYPDPTRKYPPGQKPEPTPPRDIRPADRYPSPQAPRTGKPADRYPSPEAPRTGKPADRYPSPQRPAPLRPADRYPEPQRPSSGVQRPDGRPADRYPSPQRPAPLRPADRYPSPSPRMPEGDAGDRSSRRTPPGQKPERRDGGRPADRYPSPQRPTPSRPADRYPNPGRSYPPGQRPSQRDTRPVDRLPSPSPRMPEGDAGDRSSRGYPPGQTPSPRRPRPRPAPRPMPMPQPGGRERPRPMPMPQPGGRRGSSPRLMPYRRDDAGPSNRTA